MCSQWALLGCFPTMTSARRSCSNGTQFTSILFFSRALARDGQPTVGQHLCPVELQLPAVSLPFLQKMDHFLGSSSPILCFDHQVHVIDVSRKKLPARPCPKHLPTSGLWRPDLGVKKGGGQVGPPKIITCFLGTLLEGNAPYIF